MPDGLTTRAASPSNVLPYLLSIIALAGFGLIAVVLVFWLRPQQDNTPLIVSIMGFVGPTMVGLMAYLKAQETHLSVNSRLDEMMRNAAAIARADGVAEGRLAGTKAAEVRSDELSEKKIS